jgi:hypothetical protein
MKFRHWIVTGMAVTALALGSFVAEQPGEAGALGARLEQADIAEMNVTDAAAEGMRIFTTPFNKLDGYGDGPLDPADTISPGGRPTLQGNGTLLRVNGLDAQACFECHTLVSNATIPATLGIGGAGGTNANAMFQPSSMNPADDDDLDGAAEFTGRFINPPFVFGVGGVELVGLEMTTDLQALKQQAIDSPGVPVLLHSKGVEFGSIVADGLGNVDTSAVEGVADDLVIRPFGRKGDNATTRDFDIGAMQFHFGMQPTEAVGPGDPDGDGVDDEILPGELSALGVFLSTLARPVQAKLVGAAVEGEALFANLGCADCHVPVLDTSTRYLPLRFPQVATDPSLNIYTMIDLTKKPAGFSTNANGGIRVPMFSDLKRHNMGPGLAEDFALASDEENAAFITAKLWGVVDSGPWLHDGRALTISDAILLHGGEAQDARDAFDAMTDDEKVAVLSFLRTLQTPKPNNSGGNGNGHPRTLRPAEQTNTLSSHTVSRR